MQMYKKKKKSKILQVKKCPNVISLFKIFLNYIFSRNEENLLQMLKHKIISVYLTAQEKKHWNEQISDFWGNYGNNYCQQVMWDTNH